ncbi:MAG: hypothetical protein Q8M92_02665 [Candidatus Subteraquimicrobiales bacterium]|nr:hypothetical protein [Candidatus Subteraquimicrobiales bacterium]
MKENLTHHNAFDYYYSQGDALTVDEKITRVSSEFNRSKSTIYMWKKMFKWDEKKHYRDIQNARKLEERTDTTILEAKAKYLSIIQDTLTEYRRALRSGGIRINSVQDLERLARLEISLREEEAPEEDKEVNIIFKTIKKSH